MQRLFQHLGKHLGQTLDQLARAIAPGSHNGDPAKTYNFRQCELLAEDIAARSGSLLVREEDLLWALLIRGKESRSFDLMCKQLGLDLNQLNQALANQCSRPPLPDSLRFGYGPPA